MARIVITEATVAVVILNAQGEETTLCIRNPENPLAILFGYVGGVTCARVTQLRAHAPDGAQTLVAQSGLGLRGTETKTARSLESTDQIVTAMVAAGFRRPEIRYQGRIAAWWERQRYPG